MDVQDWKDPEPRASAGAAKNVADALRVEKDKWAVIEEYEVPQAASDATEEEVAAVAEAARKVRAKASSRASLIKQGRVAAFRSLEKRWPGTFEAVSRTRDEGGKKIIRVFARYVGEEFAEEPKAKEAKAKDASAPIADGSGPSEAEVAEATPVDEVANV